MCIKDYQIIYNFKLWFFVLKYVFIVIFYLLDGTGKVLNLLIFSSGQHTSLFGLPFVSLVQTKESFMYFPMSAEMGFCKFFIKALSWSQFSCGTQIDFFPLGAVHGVGKLDCSGLVGSPKSNWNGLHDTLDKQMHSQRINTTDVLLQQDCNPSIYIYHIYWRYITPSENWCQYTLLTFLFFETFYL